MMKYSHESEELNALLGKMVKITFWDDTTATGILSRGTWKRDRYEIKNSYTFRKTHVKKVEVVR